MFFRSLCSTGFYWKVENNVSVQFIVLNLQAVFPLKTHVFGRSFIFYTFVCRHGALHLRLRMVALPASVTMSRPAKITSKLNMSGLDFLLLVLQSSNSFDLKAFFQVLFSLIHIACRRNVNLLLSESLRSTVSLCKVEFFFCSFFGLKLQTVSPLIPCFRKAFLIYTFSGMLIL